MKGMLFRYITRALHSIIAGRALAACNDPTQHLFPPTIEAFINQDNLMRYTQFAVILFRLTGLSELNDPARLLQFRDGMIAAFLMHYDEFEKHATDTDPVLRKVKHAAHEVGIDLTELRMWGKAIRERFDVENAAQAVDSSINPGVVASIQDMGNKVVSLGNEVASLKDEKAQMRRSIQSLEANQHQ